jgi:ParB family chromosome partitioning protein
MMTSHDDNPSRKALGRGLAALIPTAVQSPATEKAASGDALRLLPVERIQPNRSQPRKTFDEAALNDLSESIKDRGVIQPIVVRRSGDGYEIIAGERRWRAATKAGLRDIPAFIKDVGDSELLQLALIENIQREDLDPIEEAEAYSRLIRDYNLTQERVATAVGKNRATIANALRLLKLPEPVLEMLGQGKITAGHARAIMTLDTDKAKEKLAKDIVIRKLSVREAEARARQLKKASANKGAAPEQPQAERAVEERIMRSLGTKVRLVNRKGKGRLEIMFHNLDQLEDILDKIDS